MNGLRARIEKTRTQVLLAYPGTTGLLADRSGTDAQIANTGTTRVIAPRSKTKVICGR